MEGNINEQTSSVATSKSFITVGPTLHYSHNNVVVCWFLSFVVFCICCVFWTKVTTGEFFSFSFSGLLSLDSVFLGHYITEGVSIFEYPWQILVVGMLMGVFAVCPVLVSQLMAFQYSLPFIAALFFLANLPGFALALLFSCFAVACRPLRFRSRFTAIALCTVPQLLYWGFLGGARGAEPITWGFSFTPWICAWLVGLAIVAIVLGTGHFTRYRPGLVLGYSFLFLVASIIIFEMNIGFDELDYQLYVFGNNPEQVDEFRRHSITDSLNEAVDDPLVQDDLLNAFFYSLDMGDKIEMRKQILQLVVESLEQNSWPGWFAIGDELRYQEKRQWLIKQYDKFLNDRPESPRIPIVLYFKAILLEYRPNINNVKSHEEIVFYNDYPNPEARDLWHRLYRDYPDSAESLEARWRIAKHWAGDGRFAEAEKLLAEGEEGVSEVLSKSDKNGDASEDIFSLFKAPPDTVMTYNLIDLKIRISELKSLISEQNYTDDEESKKRLSKFVMLNPHGKEFAWKLAELLSDMSEGDRLRDNVLLAQDMQIEDDQRRAESLKELHEKYLDTDGGARALYELCLLKRKMWSQQQGGTEQKQKLLSEMVELCNLFLGLHQDSIYSEQIRNISTNLPKQD